MCKFMKPLVFSVAFILSGYGINAQELRKISIAELEKEIFTTKQPVLYNFWATWCAPCIEEMPYFEKVARQHKIRLVFVSLDAPKAWPSTLSDFVKKQGLTTPVYWLNESDADYFCPKIDSSWSGSIPATLYIDPAGKSRKFSEGQLSEKELREFIGRQTPE